MNNNDAIADEAHGYFESANYSKQNLIDHDKKSHNGTYPVKDKVTEKLGTGSDTIKIIKNFMNKDDLDLIMEKVNGMWGFHKPRKDKVLIANDLIFYYKEKMKLKAEELFNLELEYDNYASPIGEDFHLAGRLPNFVTQVHSDNLDIDKMKYDKYRWSGHISNLIYLNNNYDGGELYFIEHDLMVKPEPGMLISFPGNFWNRHGILPASDYRFAISIFFKIKDFS
jgi:hypothetical protein